jgi:nitrite reductase (NADH) small subunit
MQHIHEEKVYTKVAMIDELPFHSGKTLRYKGIELALFRLGDHEVKAIENRCPHKGGVLAEGIVSGQYVFCPLHDRKIDLSSGLVQAPDTGCVRTFEVIVKEKDIYISFAAFSEMVG